MNLIDSLTTNGMMDKSRLALCMVSKSWRNLKYTKTMLQVMFTMVFLNPLSPLLHETENVYRTEGSMGRTILEVCILKTRSVFSLTCRHTFQTESSLSFSQLIKISSSSLLLSMFNVLFILAGE